ncbi:hypothetical protein BC829DRAFT_434470 [Chytridium lagenaria]|nr:hypothetical protein BC829DRAFT_434470 [Chytridium lagenaria]
MALTVEDPETLWRFATYTFVTAIVSLFYFFYLNRTLARLLSSILCFYTWRRYRIWISLDSIAFAPLTGKIMFKNLRYKSCNESVHILRGHVTFRFWIPKVRQINGEGEENRPCRIKIRLDGFEWFVYNRTEAYEFLRSVLEPTSPADSGENARHSQALSNGHGSMDSFASLEFKAAEAVEIQSSTGGLLSKFLPIEFVGQKGSIVIGNQDIPTLVILHYKDLTGEYTTGKAASELDSGSTHFKASLTSAKLILKRNVDYREPLLNQAARLRAQRVRAGAGWARFLFPRYYRKQRLASDESHADTPFEWLGLARYNVGNDPLQRKSASEEYAKAENMLESECLNILYFADVAGIQTHDSESTQSPKWGIEMKVKNGSMNYGPWTNRQRLVVQDFFFPNSFRNNTKTERAKVGQKRIHETFEFSLVFEGSTTIRIPFKEPSKDWKYAFNMNDDEAQVKTSSGSRQAGWFDLKTNSFAEMKFDIPIVANDKGYKTAIQINLSEISLLSSLDFSTFLRAQKVQVSGDMESPLIWNAERAWDFNLHLNRAKIFILRDHITLLQDLIADFSYGPAVESLNFIPVKYGIYGALTESEISVYTNYNNVIYQPNDLEENNFIIARVEELKFSVDLPFISCQPPGFEIPFNVKTSNVEMVLNHSRSSTLGSFVKEKDKKIGIAKEANLCGKYRFNSKYQPGLLDNITCDIEASDCSFQVPGIMIRFFINFASNYLGDFVNFLTIEEYRSRLAEPERHANNQKRKEAANGPYNMMEFLLTAKVTNGVAVIPENLYGFQQAVVARITSATVTSRSTEFFFDLVVAGGPVVCSHTNDFKGDFANLLNTRVESQESELYVDSVTFTGMRLFGPKPKFLCYAADWRLEVGPVLGNITTGFLGGLKGCLDSFLFGMSDRDNTLFWEPFLPEVDTFHVVANMIEITVTDPLSCVFLLLSTPNGLSFQYDSYIRDLWMSRSIVFMPRLTISGFSSLPQDGLLDDVSDTVAEVFNFDCKISLSFFGNDKNRDDLRLKQLKFLIEQDRETNRCSFLYEDQRELLVLLGREEDNLRWTDILEDAAPMFDPPFSLLFPDIAIKSAVESSFSERFVKIRTRSNFSRRRPSETFRNSQEEISRKPAPAYYSTLRKFKRESYELADYSTSLGDNFIFSRLRSLDKSPPEKFAMRASVLPSPMVDSFTLETSNFSLSGSTVCLEAIGPILMMITPDALGVVDALVSPLISPDTSTAALEKVIDDLYIQYFAKLDSGGRVTSADFNAAVLIPRVDIKVIQDLSSAAESRFGGVSFNVAPSTCLEIALESIAFRYSSIEEASASSVSSPVYSSSASLDVGSLLCTIKCLAAYHDFVVEKLPTSYLHSTEHLEALPVVGQARVCGLQLFNSSTASKSRSDNKISMRIDTESCDIIFTNQTIEVMVFSTFPWLSKAKSLHESLQSKMIQRENMTRKIVFHTLDFSRKALLTADLPFLSSPSGVWVLGYKREYQADSSWKFLCYLRHGLRTFDRSTEITRPEDISDQKPALEAAVQLVERWRVRDHRELANARVLLDLFGRLQNTPEKPEAASVVSGIMKLIVTVSRLKFTIYDNESNPNYVDVDGITIEVGSHPREQSPTNVVVREASRSRSKSKSEQPKTNRPSIDLGRVGSPLAAIERYIDLSARVTIENIVVATDSNFLRFCREIILLAKRIPTAVPVESPSSIEVKSSIIHGLTVSAAAHSLYMTSVVKNAFSSVIYFTEDLKETPKVWSASIVTFNQRTSNSPSPRSSASIPIVSNVVDVRRPQDAGGLLGITLESILGSISAALEPISRGSNSTGGWNMGIFGSLGSLNHVDDAIQDLGYDETQNSSKLSKDNPFSRMNFHFLLNKFAVESDLLSAFKAVYSIDKSVVVVDLLVKIVTAPLRNPLWRHQAFNLPNVSCKGRLLQYPDVATSSGDAGKTGRDLEQLKANVRLGSGEISLNANVLDQLRTAQSLLGAEVNDIMEVANSRKSTVQQQEAAAPSESVTRRLFYSLKITMEGLRISLESPLSYLEFQSKFLQGFVMNYPKELESRNDLLIDKMPELSKLLWRFLVNGFSLSLLQSFRIPDPSGLTEARQIPLAFVIMDFFVQNFRNDDGDSSGDDGDQAGLDTLFLLFHKIHAVMHPSALGKLVDSFLYYKKELERSNFRTAELNQIRNQLKENTQRLLTTVDIVMPTPKPSKSFFDKLRIAIEVNNFSTAVPLSGNEESIIGSLSSLHTNQVVQVVEPGGAPAFMFSIRHIVFSSSRFAKSAAHLRDLCLQFVPAFDQTQDLSFSPSAYPVQNRLLLENIHAQVNQSNVNGVSVVSIMASIRGFDLDMESNIADYINSLSDIIRKGRERVISALPAADLGVTASVSSLASASEDLEETAVALTFDGTFEFHAGRCKLNGPTSRSATSSVAPGDRGAYGSLPVASPSSPRQMRVPKFHSRQASGTSSVDVDVPIEEFKDQVLYLPGITLWVEGKTIIGETKKEMPGEFERNICIEVLVHPSDNTIHPSILVFFSQLMTRLKVHTSTSSDPVPILSSSREEAAGRGIQTFQKSHSVTVFVRLSETKVSLSCQPISKVALTFTMEEADILLTFVPPSSGLPEGDSDSHLQTWSVLVGIRRTAGFLRHAFSPEDCFRGEIPSLAMSLVLVGEPERRRYALEVDLPSLEGSLNVRYLQDFFLFRRLWLNISYTSGPTATPAPPSPSPSPAPFAPPHRRQLIQRQSNLSTPKNFLDSFHCVFRLGKIEVSTDLGQAVGKAMVHVDAMYLVADASWDKDDFLKKVGKIRVNAITIRSEGRLSGVSVIKGIQISSKILRPPIKRESGYPTVKATKSGKATFIKTTIDKVESQVQYQYERILILEIYPIQMEIRDDWFLLRKERAESLLPNRGSEIVSNVGIHVTVNLSIDHVKAILSRRTIPILIQTKQKLVALIEEKRRADILVSSPSTSPAMEYDGFEFNSSSHPSKNIPFIRPSTSTVQPQNFVDASSITPSASFSANHNSKRESDTMSSLASLHTALHGSTSFTGPISGPGPDIAASTVSLDPSIASPLHTLQRLSGRLRIKIGNTFITFTRYNFRDPDCAQLVSKHVIITLDRENLPPTFMPRDPSDTWVQLPLAQNGVTGFPASVQPWAPLDDDIDLQQQSPLAAEMTVAELGGFSVKKCSAKTISQAEERMWSGSDWFTFMNASAAKNVIGFPAAVVVLRTEVGDHNGGLGSVVGATPGALSPPRDCYWQRFGHGSKPQDVTVSSSVSTSGCPGSEDLLSVPSNFAPQGPSKAMQVDYSFRSDFAGQIDIALNLGLYRYLQELKSLYEKAIITSSSGGGGGGGVDGGGDDDDAAALKGDVDDGDLLGTTLGSGGLSSGGSGAAPISGGSSSSTSASSGSASQVNSGVIGGASGGTSATISLSTSPSPSPLTFNRKGEVKFDPQLKVTGDATPWELVQWLGVNRERVPELVFANLTMTLAQVLSDAQKLVLRTRVGDVSGSSSKYLSKEWWGRLGLVLEEEFCLWLRGTEVRIGKAWFR